MSTEFQSSSSDTSVANAPRFQCRHIQTGGLRCGSRCLRNQDFCYYHHTTRRPKSVLEAAAQASRLTRHEARNAAFELPNPEDRSSIQHSIGEVLRRIAANTLDPRRAGLLLYGLQIASMNLHKETPKPLESWESPEPVDEIVDDPDFGPIAPRAEFATRPHEKSLAELLTEQWEKGDEREAEERAARTLAALKRQAAADNFTLPAILPDLSAEAEETTTTAEPEALPLSVLTRSVRNGTKCLTRSVRNGTKCLTRSVPGGTKHLLGAGRRYEPSHPQVLHHLPIVVEPVRHGKVGHHDPRRLLPFERHHFKGILNGKRRVGLVQSRKRLLQRPHDLVLRSHRTDRLIVHLLLPAHEDAGEVEVRLRQVLHLLRERPDGVELRARNRQRRRREAIFLRGHRLDHAHAFALEDLQQPLRRFRWWHLGAYRRAAARHAHLRLRRRNHRRSQHRNPHRLSHHLEAPLDLNCLESTTA